MPARGDHSHPNDPAAILRHRFALRCAGAYALLLLLYELSARLLFGLTIFDGQPVALRTIGGPLAFLCITTPLIYFAFKKLAARETASEAAQRASLAQLQCMAEMSSDWYWETDSQLRLINVAGTSRHGVATPSTNLLGKRFSEISHFVLLSMSVAEFEALRTAHKPYRDVRGRIANPKGGNAYVSISGQPRFDASGSFLGYHGVTRDVTNEFEAQESLRLSEANFRAIAEHPGIAKALVLPDGRAIYVNRSYCSLLGYTEAELLAGNSLDFTVCRQS